VYGTSLGFNGRAVSATCGGENGYAVFAESKATKDADNIAGHFLQEIIPMDP